MRPVDRSGDLDDTRRLRALLRAGDEAVHVPDDLWEQVRRPRTPSSVRPAPRRRLAVVAASVAGVLIGAAAGLAAPALRHPPRHHGITPAAGDVVLTVYNAETACQPLRTIECSLAVVPDPRGKYDRTNVVARVWHGDRLRTDCVISDGTPLTDEAGVTSTRWYHVVLDDGTVGWLSGVRTRNTVEVRGCPQG